MSSHSEGSGLGQQPPNFRLYIDESGDDSKPRAGNSGGQHLCLLGCLFEDKAYRTFHDELERLRREFFPEHHPDNPTILHREDMINRRGGFLALMDPLRSAAFDEALFGLIGGVNCNLIAAVINKEKCAAHFKARGIDNPDYYGNAYRGLLSRYAEFLHNRGASGTVLVEARGGRQDGILQRVHTVVLNHGIGQRTGLYFSQVIRPAELDVRAKSANISGLQLADLLCHPLKRLILQEAGEPDITLGRFAQSLVGILQPRLSMHETQAVENYGFLLSPKQRQNV